MSEMISLTRTLFDEQIKSVRGSSRSRALNDVVEAVESVSDVELPAVYRELVLDLIEGVRDDR